MKKQSVRIFASITAYSLICVVLITSCIGFTKSFAKEYSPVECEEIIEIEDIASTCYDFCQTSQPVDIIKSSPSEIIEPLPQEADTTVQEDYISLSQDEIELISKILYLEGRGESYECQQAIVSVIINRMTTENKDAHEIIFAENQFTTSQFVEKGKVTEEIKSIVIDIAANGPTIPNWVTYFRAKKYHQWDNKYGTVIPYDKIDNTYFSYDKKLYDEYNK